MGGRAIAAIALVGVASAWVGCFNPNTPAGAYTCNATDRSCPVGQHCSCGLCVNRDDQAACGFVLSASVSGGVVEHQPFTLAVQARLADGTTIASGFSGAVTLTSSWGDVTPKTLMLTNGQASATVSLNRETLPPQTATIRASFAGNEGTSNKIAVKAPPLVRDPVAVVAPVSATQPFGFADQAVMQPDVIKTADDWRLYFRGLSSTGGDLFGVARSRDGKSFAPPSQPILAPGGAAFDARSIGSPAVFALGGAMSMLFSGADNASSVIGVATSPDGLTPFSLANGDLPTIRRADCGYCQQSIDFPSVIPDPAAPPAGDGGVSTAQLAFFSATAMSSIAIGRASSSDGVHFVPEPAPLLTGDLTGEAVLMAPRVLVDGTVYKMWYSFARLADYKNGDPCQSTIGIGYATSSDGFYWIRSPANPVMPAGGGGWDDTSTAFLVGSVVPSDGQNVQNGLTLYYSTFRLTVTGSGSICLPNGIGRASRP
jgi:hypothetical protein